MYRIFVTITRLANYKEYISIITTYIRLMDLNSAFMGENHQIYTSIYIEKWEKSKLNCRSNFYSIETTK